MNKADEVYLDDIARAIESIENFTRAVDFGAFIADEMRYQAVIRMLEIIGEASNQISDSFCEHNPAFPVRKAIAMRNFLIHGYDEINLEVVWQTIQEDIPQLKAILQDVRLK